MDLAPSGPHREAPRAHRLAHVVLGVEGTVPVHVPYGQDMRRVVQLHQPPRRRPGAPQRPHPAQRRIRLPQERIFLRAESREKNQRTVVNAAGFDESDVGQKRSATIKCDDKTKAARV